MAPTKKEVRAILLLGPTGAGKTPLGEYFEKKGFGGRKCLHFDFGHEMRSIALGNRPPEGFDKEEHSFIRDVLDKGLLLENEHFPIAKKIIDFFGGSITVSSKPGEGSTFTIELPHNA